MLKPDDRRVENKVLETYLKENPSTYYIEKNSEVFDKLKEYGDRLYTHSLKILPRVFKDAKLLEFGTGTGERSTNFLRWGADCTFVEMNKKSVERASFLFEKFYPESSYQIVNKSLFDYQSGQTFDITISNAVLHHTPNVEQAFAHLVSFTKPGGLNVIGIGNTGACIQRNLQRFIVYSFAGRDENEIERVVEDLFTEHLDRAEKFGGRARKAIIADTYINPKMDFISVSDLLGWYKKYDLTPYTSWPPITPNVLADDLAGKTDYRNYPDLLSYPEWIWGTQITMDADLLVFLNEELSERSTSFRNLAGSLNDVNAETLDSDQVYENVEQTINAFNQTNEPDIVEQRGFKTWLNEIGLIMKAIHNKDYEGVASVIKNSTLLFRGKGGIGLNYFAAIKN